MIRAFKYLAAIAAMTIGFTAFGRQETMQEATTPPPAPSAEQAVVEFLRPSKMGGAIRCAIFDVTEGAPRLLGILRPKQKLVVAAPAGKRLYMITGENADFMEAELEAGKTFHAVAIARMGAWKARFSLIPLKLHPGEDEWNLKGKKAAEWLQRCKYMTMSQPAADQWATENSPSILKKKDAYLPKFQEMDESLKQYRRLIPEDGQ